MALEVAKTWLAYFLRILQRARPVRMRLIDSVSTFCKQSMA